MIVQVKIAVHHVRLGAAEFRVIRPAKPLANGALYDTGSQYHMYADRADGRRIGALWLLAARSPRSLVYLPMRATPAAPGVNADWDKEERCPDRPLDLVLVHHSLQFPPSRWKQVRKRITAGSPPCEIGTASVPDSDLPADEEIDYRALNYQENKDTLHQRVHAETLFLTGSTAAFRQPARHFFAVAKEGPPAAATSLYISGGCNYHVCRLFYWPHLDPGGGQDIHLEYAPRWTI
ncbi:MAG TPA: hypothetical protein VM347_11595 [Nonomuraea sp.]|nr:hypothetical protein [Nonomuraea sp.]